MRLSRRIFTVLLVTIMITSLCFSATATLTRASAYLSAYYGAIADMGNGDIAIDFEIRGVTYMDEVGASKIVLKKMYPGTGTWTTVKTYYSSSNSSMVENDVRSHWGTLYYSGEEGVNYKATITVYAEKDGGSDSRTFDTSLTYTN